MKKDEKIFIITLVFLVAAVLIITNMPGEGNGNSYISKLVNYIRNTPSKTDLSIARTIIHEKPRISIS